MRYINQITCPLRFRVNLQAWSVQQLGYLQGKAVLSKAALEAWVGCLNIERTMTTSLPFPQNLSAMVIDPVPDPGGDRPCPRRRFHLSPIDILSHHRQLLVLTYTRNLFNSSRSAHPLHTTPIGPTSNDPPMPRPHEIITETV